MTASLIWLDLLAAATAAALLIAALLVNAAHKAAHERRMNALGGFSAATKPEVMVHEPY